MSDNTFYFYEDEVIAGSPSPGGGPGQGSPSPIPKTSPLPSPSPSPSPSPTPPRSVFIMTPGQKCRCVNENDVTLTDRELWRFPNTKKGEKDCKDDLENSPELCGGPVPPTSNGSTYPPKGDKSGALVANFVLPSWFKTNSSLPFDFLGLIDKPLGCTKGGFISVSLENKDNKPEQFVFWDGKKLIDSLTKIETYNKGRRKMR